MSFPIRIPFADTLGFEFIGWNDGQSEIAVELRDNLCNSWGVAHGGVLMTLLDIAMASAACRGARGSDEDTDDLLARAPGVVTIEMKTSFMQPGAGRLVGRGRVLHQTASMAFCEASVHDAEGQPVAHATGTFKSIRGLPVGGRLIQRSYASDEAEK